MPGLRELTLSVTFIFLTASVALLVPGLLGIGASGPLFAVILAAAAVLSALRPQIGDLPQLFGYRVGVYLREVWVGPVLAVVLVLLIEPTASAAELQAIGGVAGFFGMVNYFVRPLYLFLIRQVWRLLPSERTG